MFDLIIRSGQIVDGTGSPAYLGTVATSGDRISIHRGDTTNLRGRTEIDATDRVICPGFIDLHSHGGLTILCQPLHEPKIRQGVTTELIGVDGISHAPFKNQDELHRYIWLDAGVNGYPPMPATWLGVADYLSSYDRKVAVNIAYILGNSPVRIWAVGWSNRRATLGEIQDMQSVVREAMQEGAFGLSTGLDYPPGAYADTAEIAALCEIVSKVGGFYHTHTRSSLSKRGLLAPWYEALEIGRRSGVAVHLTHYRQDAQGVGSHLDYLDLVERGRDEGLDVTFDCYPYPLSAGTAAGDLPQWTKDGGPEQLIAILSSTKQRAKLRAQMHARLDIVAWSQGNWLTNFSRAENRDYDGKSLQEIANMRGQDPVDSLADLLISENLGISVVALGTNPQTLAAFVAHPYGMIASDAILLGEYPNPRSYGCFPVVLAEFVRSEKQLRLPEAIRKMTSFPAQRLGLADRGILKDGFFADIVVFDPRTVKTLASRENPKQFPIGIEYVIVNGQIVIEKSRHTGALPGRTLRRGKA